MEHVRHSANANISLAGAVERALEGAEKVEEAGQRWKLYANTYISLDKGEKFIYDHKDLTKPAKDYISLQFRQEVQERGGNLWALYSAITHYATHKEARNPQTAFTSMLERQTKVRSLVENEANFSCRCCLIATGQYTPAFGHSLGAGDFFIMSKKKKTQKLLLHSQAVRRLLCLSIRPGGCHRPVLI